VSWLRHLSFDFRCRAAGFRVEVIGGQGPPCAHGVRPAVCGLDQVDLFLCEALAQPDFILLDLALRFGCASLA
jgi:hypothetical protein